VGARRTMELRDRLVGVGAMASVERLNRRLRGVDWRRLVTRMMRGRLEPRTCLCLPPQPAYRAVQLVGTYSLGIFETSLTIKATSGTRFPSHRPGHAPLLSYAVLDPDGRWQSRAKPDPETLDLPFS
jgi:hypothetical protein